MNKEQGMSNVEGNSQENIQCSMINVQYSMSNLDCRIKPGCSARRAGRSVENAKNNVTGAP
jgi:hypothetical protein